MQLLEASNAKDEIYEWSRHKATHYIASRYMDRSVGDVAALIYVGAAEFPAWALRSGWSGAELSADVEIKLFWEGCAEDIATKVLETATDYFCGFGQKITIFYHYRKELGVWNLK